MAGSSAKKDILQQLCNKSLAAKALQQKSCSKSLASAAGPFIVAQK
jgi:hypothetical protein